MYRLRKEGHFPAPRAVRVPAALLHTDISGYTALTERLERRGRVGAEEISRVLEQAFLPAIRSIERWRGSITTFGGDALFTVFLGESPVRRALAAAEEIRGQMARRREYRTTAGPVSLGASQALHHGTIESRHLGADRARHYVVTGPAVRTLVRMQGRTEAGALSISRSASARVSGESRPRPWERRLRPVRSPLFQDYLPAPLLPVLGRTDGEYRRIALLFLETAGGRIGALQAFFLGLRSTLDAFDGVLLKSDVSEWGTKWLCVFGTPRAGEDDASRAALVALDVLARPEPALRVRGGLHVGTVVNVEIGTGARRSFDVLGDVVNTAARAMGKACWGQVLATDEARREIACAEAESAGSFQVKGKALPLTLHALFPRRPRTVPSSEGTLLGREAELEVLTTALREAEGGAGSVLSIAGDAGIGKTRLAAAARELAARRAFGVHEGRAVAFRGMPYWAMGELVRSLLGVSPKGPVREGVVAEGQRLGLAPVDVEHLLIVAGATSERAPGLGDEAARLNDLIAVRSVLRARSAERPLLVVLEDEQWADGLTRALVRGLVPTVHGARVVMVLLSRVTTAPEGVRLLALDGLPREVMEAMVARANPHLPGQTRDRLCAQAEGNPLYLEELLRHVGSGSATGPDELPGRIESLLEARLARLGPAARRLAQVGAVMGRSFPAELVIPLMESERAAERSLQELVAADILRPVQDASPLEYLFTQALLRDVAYGTILQRHRRRLHRHVAECLESWPSRERDARLALLGHHWEHAGAAGRAVACYLAAARRAVNLHGHEEAEKLFRAAIGLMRRPSPDAVAARDELARSLIRTRGRYHEASRLEREALRMARRLKDRSGEARAMTGLALAMHHEGAVEEAEDIYLRAAALHRRRGDAASHSAVWGGLAKLRLERGDLRESIKRYEKALRLAGEASDRGLQGQQMGSLAGAYLHAGRMEEARQLYETAIGIAADTGDLRLRAVFQGNLASLILLTGQADRARELYAEALEAHRIVGDRAFQALTIGNLANLAHGEGDWRLAGELYREAVEIHRETGSMRSESVALGNLAGLHVDAGRHAEALASLERALGLARQVRDRWTEGFVLGSLGELHGARGDDALAVACLDEAIAIHRETGNVRMRCYHLSRLAWIEAGRGDVPTARDHLREALERLPSLDDPVLLAAARIVEARIARLSGLPEAAARRLSEAEAALRATRSRPELIRCLCERGLLELDRGQPADETLREAHALLGELQPAADSDLSRRVAELRQAAGSASSA